MLSRRLVQWAIAFVALLAGVLAFSSPVAAHTDFESSTPADGDVVDEIVDEITIRFTAEAKPAGEGFTVLDPTGTVREPSTVTTDDDKVFVLGFDPPLAGGPIGVRWMVQAGDAHPIDGSFSFTVTAPAPTSPPTTGAPSTTAEPETTDVPETTQVPVTSAVPDSTAPTTVTPSTTEDVTAEAAGDAPAASTPPTGGDDTSGVSLEEFLATESSTSGEGRQLAGRAGSYLGLIGAIGGMAFLGFTLRGTRREIDAALVALVGLGLLTAAGAGLEYWGWLQQSEGTFFGEMTSTPGLAMTLRVAGGLVIAGALATVVWSFSDGDRQGRPARSLSASALTDTRPSDLDADPMERWDPRSAPVAWFGAALLVASFWFDGHTVSEGPRIVHAAVNSIHVVAAAVWVGGVISLLALLVSRQRRNEPSGAAELIVRFSSIAAAALAAVVLAGALMAVFVLDSPGELTSTEWGQVLLLKSVAVGIAAIGGAYNHFRLRPRLEAAPDDPRLTAEFRSTLIAEAIVLTFVVITTAWLVVAAT